MAMRTSHIGTVQMLSIITLRGLVPFTVEVYYETGQNHKPTLGYRVKAFNGAIT